MFETHEDDMHGAKWGEARADHPVTRMEPHDLVEMGVHPAHPLDSEQAKARHTRLMDLYVRELDVQAEQRRQMAEDEAFYDGEQWDPEDAATIRSRGQVPLVYNVISPAVNWMLGTERRGRTDFKVLPREKSDREPAKRKTEILKYLSDANNQGYHESLAYGDAVKAGIGWLEEGWQGDSGKEPIFLRRESWRNVVWDSRSQELDMSDARFIFRAKWVDMDVARSLFPGPRNDGVIKAASGTAEYLGSMLTAGDDAMDSMESALSNDAYDLHQSSRQRVRLIEAWYRVPERRAYMQGGPFRGEPYDELSPGHVASLEAGSGKLAWRTKMAVRVAIMTEKGMLYDEASPYRHDRYPFTPIWGNRRGSDGMPYGIIRTLKDIQQDVNKRASKALHILNSSRVVMEEGAVEDVDEFTEEVARPDAVIVKRPNKELIFDQGKELAAPHLELMSRSIDMIQQTSGVTDEAMGRTTNATSGKAIIARQTQGSVSTAHFLDNLRYAKRMSGEKLLSLVEQFFTEEKTFRITNKRGAPEYVTINDGEAANDILRTKADFVISEDSWNATMRQANVESLMETITMLGATSPEVVMALLDLVVEMMDLPNGEEIVKRVRQITGMTDPDMSPEEAEADPEMQARKQAEAAQMQAQQEAMQADTDEKVAQAEYHRARAERERADADRHRSQRTLERIEAQNTAIEAALLLMANGNAARVADVLMAQAEEQPAPGGVEGPLGSLPPEQSATPSEDAPMPPQDHPQGQLAPQPSPIEEPIP